MNYDFGMPPQQFAHVIDSHTEGEPTRVVVSGAPDLGNGSIQERQDIFRSKYDGFRSGVVCEPRGSEVVVGALLLEPVKSDSAAAVIFFNDVGYLGMCGHGTIGLVTTLAHMGRIQPGTHTIETSVGDVHATLHDDGSVTVENVYSYRFRADVPVEVLGYGTLKGDIAWAGNWFFLIGEHPFTVTLEHRGELVRAATSVRNALQANGITGENDGYIDHIEFFADPQNAENSSRSFVLCPGASFDRSPCGTGTSAKMACLYAAGKLKPGQTWRQESIMGTVFTGSVKASGEGVDPSIRGRAWITAESKLLFAADDPFAEGIRF